MPLTGAMRQRFAEQAAACRQMDSPFTARVIDALAERLGPDSRFGARIQTWPGDPRDDAVPLRAASALHALKRRGDPPLADAYPTPERPAGADDADLAAAIARAVAQGDDALHDWLDSPPQTNEIGRSAALLGGLLRVADETGLPIEIWELGASAGLNLRLDRYRYALGDDAGPARSWGDPAAVVEIRSAWSAEQPGHLPPLAADLRIAARAGCDQAPLDPADPDARERQIAFLWADQFARIARAEAALSAAAADGLKVARADAADWLAERLSTAPTPGRARVVTHTIFWQYLPDATRARIEGDLAAAGAAATPETPLGRLFMERDEIRGSARLALRLWGAGPAPAGDLRILGRTQFHGRWVRWTGR